MIVCCICLCSHTLSCFGQRSSALIELQKLYNQKVYFRLQTKFEHYKNTIPRQRRLFYQIVLSNIFNHCEESNRLIKLTRKTTGNDLTDQFKKKLLLIEADNYVKLYQYKKAAECYNQIIVHFVAANDAAEISDLENSKELWQTLANVPAQQVDIPRTVTVKWQPDKLGLIQIALVHHNDTCDLTFDTGANLSVISESSAKKLNMKIYTAALDLGSGISGETFKTSLAVADSLYLGKIMIRNAVFLLLPDKMLYFKKGAVQQQGFIGEPIIAQLKEITINKNGTFTVPLVPSKRRLRNLTLDELMPVANFAVGKDSLPFRFDTGASSSVLYQPFFERYRSSILKNGKPYQLHSEGAGGTVIVESPAYTITKFQISIAGHAVSLPQINVRTTPVGKQNDVFYGNLGWDLLGKFTAVTVNFKDMFVYTINQHSSFSGLIFKQKMSTAQPLRIIITMTSIDTTIVQLQSGLS